jgi:hypothetical protein
MRQHTSRMTRRRPVAWVLICAASLAVQAASAQPRAEVEVSREAVLPVTEPAAIAEWLQRLVGKFRHEGMVQVGECTRRLLLDDSLVPTDDCQPITGNSDCVSIGSGPGVQCMLNVTWLDIFSQGLEETLVSYLDPAMQLYGVDPQNAAISHLVVDNKGLAEGAAGTIKGDTATFRMPWVNKPLCPDLTPRYRVMRIQAKSESRLLFVRLGTACGNSGAVEDYAVMTLRRLPQELAEKKPEIR